MTTTYRQQWQEDGCLILPQVLGSERVAGLYKACESTYQQWKENSTEDGEPFGYCYRDNAWMLIHLNHPRYHREHREHLTWLLAAAADPMVLEFLRDVFQEEVAPLQINYYIDPPGATNPSNWHRDCQFFPDAATDASERQVIRREADPPREVHMHIPLVPTAASEVVPGSHGRWDTDEEYRIRKTDPTSNDMPGAKRLHLSPGDLAFFHVNALHRGLYPRGVPRRTIAITYGGLSRPRFATIEAMQQSRGYVATYQPWYLSQGYLDGLSPAAQNFYGNFIRTYRDNWRPEYSTPEIVGAERHFYFNDF